MSLYVCVGFVATYLSLQQSLRLQRYGKKQNGIKKTIVLFVTYHKMNKKLLLSGKQIQQIQPRLTPRGFSVELLHTDSAEDTGLELGIVIIKKEHPSLLFHQKDALLVDYQYYTL